MKCCSEPNCWSQLKVVPIPTQLVDRIRWYGSSVTEVLSRLLASLSAVNAVVLANDEFVTLQRAASIMGRNGATVVIRLPADKLVQVSHFCHHTPLVSLNNFRLYELRTRPLSSGVGHGLTWWSLSLLNWHAKD